MAELVSETEKLSITDTAAAAQLPAAEQQQSNPSDIQQTTEEVLAEDASDSMLASELQQSPALFSDAADGFEKNIEMALKAKEQGNDYFRSRQFDEAIDAYSQSIEHCPENEENKAHLATFYGNRAAAYSGVEEFEFVVEDCTRALELKPDYLKVVVRRMQAYEKLDRVDEALSDAKLVQQLDASFPRIADKIQTLQVEHNARMEKMKDEALGKLKDLGNSILGNFGMSLDNFKMNQDPNTGSWNISMGNK